MQTYLINLDKDKDRLVAADAQLKRLGVEYERFPAVYAKELPKEYIESKVNYFRFRCCVGRGIWIGEIGCCLSHYSLYQQMIDKDVPYICVLEDDVILSDRFLNTLERVEKWINPLASQVVLLSNYTNEKASGEEIRMVKKGYCTDAYVITKLAAEALLKANIPICVPCDHWARWVNHGIIQLFVALPSVCTQNNEDFETSIPSNGEKSVSDMGKAERIVFMFRRAVEKTIDRILCTLEL